MGGSPPSIQAWSADKPTRAPRAHPHSELWHNLNESFPLIFVGVVCFAVAYFLFGGHINLGNGHLPTWILFVALGAIACTGGTVSVVAVDDGPDTESFTNVDSTKFVVVPIEEWRKIQAELSSLWSEVDENLPAQPAGEASPGGLHRDLRDLETMAMKGAITPASAPDLESLVTELDSQSLSPPQTPTLVNLTPSVHAFPAKEPRAPTPPVPVPPAPLAKTTASPKAATPASALEAELMALRTALTYPGTRHSGEDAAAYVTRVTAASPAQGGSPPTGRSRSEAVVATILQAHQNLSTRDMQALSDALHVDLEGFGATLGLSPSPDEDLITFAQRIQSSLTSTRAGVVATPQEPSTNLDALLDDIDAMKRDLETRPATSPVPPAASRPAPPAPSVTLDSASKPAPKPQLDPEGWDEELETDEAVDRSGEEMQKELDTLLDELSKTQVATVTRRARRAPSEASKDASDEPPASG